MGKYQIYIYFALTAIVTATIAATLWNLFLPTERIRRLHTRKMWTVGLFFAGLTLFVSGLFVYWIVGQYKQPAAIVQGLGIGLIMTVILLGTYEASDMFRGQGLFFGSTSVIASVAALAIVVAANFYTSKNPAQYDFNADKLETLNDQTLNVLKALEKPVEVVAFLYKQEKQIAQRLRTFFKKYSDINPKKFQVRIIDPVENPSTAACYGVKGSAGSQLRNRVVLSIKGKCLQKKNRTVFSNKKIVVEKLSEQEITNKLIKLTRKRQKKVCFLRGRGQPSIESKSRYGYNEFKKQLIEKGFSTQEVNLLTSENVPKACDIVVQAVPEWTLLLRRSGKLGLSSGAKLNSFEVAKLERYLAAGGKMMIFQEPLVQSGLEGLLKKYGIVSRSGATVDFLYNHRGLPFRPMGTDFSTSHPIVKGFYRRARMPFEWATSFQRAKAVPAGVTATELIKTTKVRIGVPGGRVSAAKCCSFYIPTPLSRGFGKLMNDSRRWKRNEMLLQILRNQIVKKLIPNSEVGPHTLAMAAVKKGSKAKSQTQIVAFGDSALASNLLMNKVPEVRTVIFNSIAWLAKEKDLVHIVTRRRKPSNINISATQKKALQLVSQWGSGLFFFIMVLMVWGMRRQQ